MRRFVDPRHGDIEDDGSSTKRRSLLSLAGSLLAEVSLPKLALAWLLLIVVPALMLGVAPLVASLWVRNVSAAIMSPLNRIWPVLILAILVVVGWFGGRTLYRLAESGFWSVNSLVVEPGYVICREVLRHMVESALASQATQPQRARLRAATAVAAGFVMSGLAVFVLVLVWPKSRWVVGISELTSLQRLIKVALMNSVALVTAYLAVAALVWAIADATMAQPRDLEKFYVGPDEGRVWRIAHLSDIHVVGERYGFRIESGRSGPRGNERLRQALTQLDTLCNKEPIDTILITGDMTDAGRSTEWAELLDVLGSYPSLAERVLVLPGNHDLNIVDRANPARLDTPASPKKRLRKIRALSAMGMLQGRRVCVVDLEKGCLGESLAEAMEPYLSEMARFADAGRPHILKALTKLWSKIFPMVLPPSRSDGLGIILLNSNANTHFSFTNALGMISTEQVRGIEIAAAQYPQACWVVALHHHLVEYPMGAEALSDRIGTALINGNWFVRRLRPLASRAIVMHGHRHKDWIGECEGLLIVSAPSPVMEAADDLRTYFYIQSVSTRGDGRVRLLPPQRINVESWQSAEDQQITPEP
jgi:Calcineurin-like phosphoesterase